MIGQLLIFLKLDVWPPTGDHALQSLEGYFAKYFQSNIFIFLSVWMWPPHTARARQASSDLQLTRSTRHHHTTPSAFHVSTFATFNKMTLRQHLVQIPDKLAQKSSWPNLGGPARAPLPPSIHVDTHLHKCGPSRAWFGPNRVNFVSPCSTTATSASSQRRPLTTPATKLTCGKLFYKTRG